MNNTIKAVALDYIDSERERNFYAAGHKLTAATTYALMKPWALHN